MTAAKLMDNTKKNGGNIRGAAAGGGGGSGAVQQNSAAGIDPVGAQDEVFRLGALLECQTVNNDRIQGELVCYDQSTRLLVLKSKSPTTGTKTELRFVNLALVQRVAELRQPPAPMLRNSSRDTSSQLIGQLSSLSSVAQAEERLKRAERRKLTSFPVLDVTREARIVFLAIRKTLDETRWDGERIVVLEKVAIGPPYGRENVHPLASHAEDHKARETALHVQKIIDKHNKAGQQQSHKEKSASPASSASSTNTATTTTRFHRNKNAWMQSRIGQIECDKNPPGTYLW